MYLLSLSRLLLASMLFVLSFSVSVMATPIVSVVPTGDTAYTVLGRGMDGVAGIQLDIIYDAALLGAPAVTQGGLAAGAMFAAHTPRPGLIKIAVIRSSAFSGSGTIAAINFTRQQGTGGIISANVTMIDSAGAAVPASVSVAGGSGSVPDPLSTPGLPLSQSGQTTPATPATTTVTTSTPTYLGTITLPAEQQQRVDSQPAVPVYTGEPAAARNAEQNQSYGKPVTDTKVEETPQYVVYKGILDLFKQYHGDKSLSTMAALFDKKVAQSIRQEPAILLSDGQSKAVLTVDIPARISSSPNFAVNGGTLDSLKQDKQIRGRWIAAILPETGAIKVSMTIIAGAEEFEYPLTVAPPTTVAPTLDERGWQRFLNEVGTSAAPLHDLNNDGVRDYIDEYIFVANYLSHKTAFTKPAAVKVPRKK